MSCCSGVETNEDGIRLSKTMDKAIRDMYWRDKNYLDVYNKIAKRNFLGPVWIPGGGYMYQIPGHNTYIQTADGTARGRIVAIIKPRQSKDDEQYRLTYYYVSHRHTEFYGKVDRYKKFNGYGEIFKGSMKSLDERTSIKVDDFYNENRQAMRHRTLNEDGMRITEECIGPDKYYEHNGFICNGLGITNSRDNRIYVYLCDQRYASFSHETQDRRNDLLAQGREEYDLFFPRVFIPKLRMANYDQQNNTYLSEDIIITNGDMFYDDNFKKGVKVKFKIKTGELVAFADNSNWKRLDNDTNYIRFRDLLRAELLHNVNSKEDERYKAYQTFLNWFGLRSKFKEIEKRIDTRQEFLRDRQEARKEAKGKRIKNKNHLHTVNRANMNLDNVSEDKKSLQSIKYDDHLNLNIKKNRKKKNDNTLANDLIKQRNNRKKLKEEGSVMSNDDLNKRVINYQ